MARGHFSIIGGEVLLFTAALFLQCFHNVKEANHRQAATAEPAEQLFKWQPVTPSSSAVKLIYSYLSCRPHVSENFQEALMVSACTKILSLLMGLPGPLGCIL